MALLTLILVTQPAIWSEPSAEETPCNIGLDDLLERASINNFSLQAVGEQVGQAKQAVAQARSVYFPQIDASASALYQWLGESTEEDLDEAFDTAERTLANFDSFFERVQGLAPRRNIRRVRSSIRDIEDAVAETRDRFESPIENYTLGLTVGYLLFDGFARKHTVAVARLGHQESEAAQQEARRLLFEAVAEAYYATQLASENVRVARSDRDFNARLLRDAEVLADYGKGPYSNVLNFRAATDAADIQVLMSEGELEAASMALAALLGFSDANLPEGWVLCSLPAPKEEDFLLPELEALLGYARAHRPDLERGELSIDRAEAEVRRRQGAYYPTVGLVAGYQSNFNLDGDLSLDGFSPNVGVSVSYNLFSGGRRMARVKDAKHARQEAEYRLADAEMNATLEVKQALLDLRISQERYTKLRAVAETIRESRQMVETSYTSGKESLARLNQSQRDLVLAEGHMVGARVELERAWFKLDTVTAKSLERVRPRVETGERLSVSRTEQKN
jgi:outer membrane protein TolC